MPACRNRKQIQNKIRIQIRNQIKPEPPPFTNQKGGAPSKAKAEIQSQRQTRAKNRATKLQSELAKWYHPAVEPVDCGEYGDGSGRPGRPRRPKPCDFFRP